MDAQAQQRTASLYVGDLPVDMNNPEEALGRLFGSVGPVASLRVCRDMNTQRSLGYAYVNFQNIFDAEKALETLNYTDIIPGRSIRIMPAMRDPTMRRTGTNNLFVKITDKSLTSRDLRDIFSKCGKVLSAKVCCDSKGESLGYGFVHLDSANAAKAALEMKIETFGDSVASVVPFIRRAERLAEKEKTFVNVFAKNIKVGLTEEEVRSVFEKFGTVTAFFLSGHPQHETLFAILSFSTHDAAVSAIAGLNGSEDANIAAPGSKLFVGRALKKRDRLEIERRNQTLYQSQGRNLYVKHLDPGITREKLEEVFSRFGKITSCTVMKDSTGVSREFGFVCFENKEDAETALREMNGKTVFSKPLYVSHAEQKDMRRHMLQERMQRMFRQQQQQQIPALQRMAFNPTWSRNYPATPVFKTPPTQQFVTRRHQSPMFTTNPSIIPPPPQQQQVQPFFVRNHAMNRTHYAAPTALQPRPLFPAHLVQQQQHPHPHQLQQQQQQQQHLVRQQQQQWQGVANEGLQASQLARLPPEERRNILGERLFKKVVEIQPSQASKITGMLLEMEATEILEILNVPSLLVARIDEAVAVLRQHAESDINA